MRKSIQDRCQLLKKLERVVDSSSDEIVEVLWQDLKKPKFEAFGSEVGFVLGELRHTLKNLEKWAKPKRVRTPLAYFPARSQILFEPLGKVLIIGPWNYPFQLIFSPLVGAIAAGNSAVLKPSELAPATEKWVVENIRKNFSEEDIRVETGGPEKTQALLHEKFDHIFFTGSEGVGKVVYEAAARNLTPVTLELGGKSPCIVADLSTKASMEVAARRIVWGKFYNCGQTCIAPDYLLVKEELKDQIVSALKVQVSNFFGANPKESLDYGRIINERHFNRVLSLVDGKIIFGGDSDRSQLYIEPTVVDEPSPSSRIMREEIFGPLLPILSFRSESEVFEKLNENPNPLACYVFTENQKFEEAITRDFKFGGGCVNDTLIHIANRNLPFGGIGKSGMGAYHGQASFELFSHRKSLVRSGFFDLPFRYPPYKINPKWLKKLL